MKALKSSADIIGKYMLKCPACDKINEFTVVNAQLAVFFDKLPVKKHAVAVCQGCNTAFRVGDDAAWRLSKYSGSLTTFDLTRMGE